jgi:hypothetical protein
MLHQIAIVERAQAEEFELARALDVDGIVQLAGVRLGEAHDALVDHADIEPQADRLRERIHPCISTSLSMNAASRRAASFE